MALRTERLLYWTIKQSPERAHTHTHSPKTHKIPSEHLCPLSLFFCVFVFSFIFICFVPKKCASSPCALVRPPTSHHLHTSSAAAEATRTKKLSHRIRMKIWIIYEENVMHTKSSELEIRIPPLYLMSMVRIPYAPPSESIPCVFLSLAFFLCFFFAVIVTELLLLLLFWRQSYSTTSKSYIHELSGSPNGTQQPTTTTKLTYII